MILTETVFDVSERYVPQRRLLRKDSCDLSKKALMRSPVPSATLPFGEIESKMSEGFE